MSGFDRFFGAEDSGPTATPREPSEPITKRWPGLPIVAVVLTVVVGIGAIYALTPQPSSDENAALELTIQEYCNGDAKWGEAIDARNQLIENYRAGEATRDDLSIAVDNFSCMDDSTGPLRSELGE